MLRRYSDEKDIIFISIGDTDLFDARDGEAGRISRWGATIQYPAKL